MEKRRWELDGKMGRQKEEEGTFRLREGGELNVNEDRMRTRGHSEREEDEEKERETGGENGEVEGRRGHCRIREGEN